MPRTQAEPEPPTLVTVVIPAHGGPGPVGRLLASLNGQAGLGRLPVVVSDDASQPPLGEALRADSYPGLDLTVVRSERNGGPGAARNRGVEVVATPWIAFLDADMEAGPGWVTRLLAITGSAAPVPAELAGVEGLVELAQEDRPTPFSHTTEFADPGSHHGAGNIVLRTDVLRAVGGYDERFFDARRHLHFREDTDLYFRLIAAGYRVDYDPLLVAHHPPLPAAWTVPIRLARRYYFDPLLAREHPAAFETMNRHRLVGPISLRAARHYAASLFGGGLIIFGAGVVSRRRTVRRAGAAAAGLGWLANVLALSWRRRISPRTAGPLLAVAAVTPLVYLFHYGRGLIAFGYRPRLR